MSKEMKLKGNKVGNIYLTFLESSKIENCLVSNSS